MYSEEVFERFRTKVPTIDPNYRYYGITQLDVSCEDGSLKQIVLLFERMRVDEPVKRIKRKEIYADVLIRIKDEVLIDIATKVIPLDDAIDQKMFKVFGDREIWNLQLTALRKLLEEEHFEPKKIKEPPADDEQEDLDTTLTQAECDLMEKEAVEPENDLSKAFKEDLIDYGNLPQMDMSDVQMPEFQSLTEHFESLRRKFSELKTKCVRFDETVKKE